MAGLIILSGYVSDDINREKVARMKKDFAETL